MTALPPLSRVELALQQATEYFAAELHSPTDGRPNWSEFEWNMARAAAVLHGVTPLLASVLRWRGPEDWQQFVSQQRLHTTLRLARIEALLARLDAAARRAGIAIVPLKGIALYRLGLYAAGERPMADVDLLIRASDGAAVETLLQTLDYAPLLDIWKHRVFGPAPASSAQPSDQGFGEHADRPIKIDLHTRIAERLPLELTDISALILHPALAPGLNAYPSERALLIHLLQHAAGNMTSRSLRLLQLHDLALLAARLSAADWEALVGSRVGGKPLWWSLPPLELLARYYPRVVPHGVLSRLRPECPRRLRMSARRQTLSEVSFARLRIEAFPGIAWSNSPAQTLRYILARILPSDELRRQRAMVAAEEAWASGNPWSRLSQRRRVLNYLLQRPARPPVMHVVQLALQDRAALAAAAPRAPDPDHDAARRP